ncbi:MAG TPA: zinc-dependent metalloprotease family protein, partial [Phycisphaerae bacterium]|nr:zinc-dependent metalloprotease family protein [Phycisphaerae bacterium]
MSIPCLHRASTVTWTVLFMGAAACPAFAANGSERPKLFVPVSKTFSSDQLDSLLIQRPALANHARRTAPAAIDLAALTSSGQPSAVLVELNLFPDVKFDALLHRTQADGSGDVHLAGRIEGVEGSCVIIVLHEGAVAGSITVPGVGLFDLKPLGNGVALVREIDLSDRAGQNCGAIDLPQLARPRQTGHPGVTESGEPDPAAMSRKSTVDDEGSPRGVGASICPTEFTSLGGFVADTNSVVELMVYYTPAALLAAGNLANLEAEIDVAVDYANQAYDNSDIDVTLSVIRVASISYNEGPDPFEALDRLVSIDDGHLDTVHADRDQYGGDLVTLWVGNTITAGGVAYQLYNVNPYDDGRYGFSVMREDNATLPTLAHELGHNFGCQHDRCNPGGSPFFDFAWGFRQRCEVAEPPPCTTPWPCEPNKDIMAYPPGITVPYFSNPNIIVGDQPIGGTDEHGGWCDNAATHNLTAFTIANFRPSQVTPLPPSRIYVNAAAAPGGNGSSWATALKDVQAGIGLAVRSRGAVQEVWVAAGTYYPDRG